MILYNKEISIYYLRVLVDLLAIELIRLRTYKSISESEIYIIMKNRIDTIQTKDGVQYKI
jgi:hypothetical protein